MQIAMLWSCRTSCFAPTVMGKATYAFQISVSSPQTRWFVLKLKPIKNILWSEVKFRALDLFFVHITCQGIEGGCAEHHTIWTQLRKKHWKQYMCFILFVLDISWQDSSRKLPWQRTVCDDFFRFQVSCENFVLIFSSIILGPHLWRDLAMAQSYSPKWMVHIHYRRWFMLVPASCARRVACHLTWISPCRPVDFTSLKRWNGILRGRRKRLEGLGSQFQTCNMHIFSIRIEINWLSMYA